MSEPSPLTEYKKVFPFTTPTCFQQDLMETCVTDLDVWREVLEFWGGNDFRPQSIKKMLDCYEEKMVGRREKPERVFTPDPPCGVCGKEICFNLHREELGI